MQVLNLYNFMKVFIFYEFKDLMKSILQIQIEKAVFRYKSKYKKVVWWRADR